MGFRSLRSSRVFIFVVVADVAVVVAVSCHGRFSWLVYVVIVVVVAVLSFSLLLCGRGQRHSPLVADFVAVVISIICCRFSCHDRHR